MAEIHDILEGLAEEYADKVGKAQEDVLKAMIKMVEDMPMEEAVATLSRLNVPGSMTLKLAGAKRIFNQGVVDMLKHTYTTTSVPESTLRALYKSVENKLSSRFTDVMGSDMRSVIMEGMATGKSPEEIYNSSKEIMDTLGHTPVNSIKQIKEAFAEYDNAITEHMAAQAPKNTKYGYIGLWDNKTRPACEAKIMFGKRTREQIINRFGNMRKEQWECRHKWEEMSSSPEDQGYKTKKFDSE